MWGCGGQEQETPLSSKTWESPPASPHAPAPSSQPLCRRGSKGHPKSSSCKLPSRRDEKQTPTFQKRGVAQCSLHSNEGRQNQRKCFLNLTFTHGFHVQLLTFFFISTPLPGYQFTCREMNLHWLRASHNTGPRASSPTRWVLTRGKNLLTAPGKPLPALFLEGLAHTAGIYIIFVSPKTFLPWSYLCPGSACFESQSDVFTVSWC